MIVQYSYRCQPGLTEVLLGEIDQPLENAVESLLKWELGYGGQITAATSIRVEVKTPILGKTDRTVFSGTKEEMRPFLEVVLASLQVEVAAGNKVTEIAYKEIGEFSGGLPLLICHLGPIHAGQAKTKLTLIALLAEDEAGVEALKDKGLEELILLYGEKVAESNG